MRRAKRRTPLRPLAGSTFLEAPAWEAVSRIFGLSRRESQVLRAIFDDLTESAIAHQLGLSPHTVHTHRQRLYVKLGVSSRPQTILRVMQELLSRKGAAMALPGTGRSTVKRPS